MLCLSGNVILALGLQTDTEFLTNLVEVGRSLHDGL